MIEKIKLSILWVILTFGIVSMAGLKEVNIDSSKIATLSKIETFDFLSNGKPFKGKIYIPDSFKTNKNLPTIYLIDFTEQHFKLATDEFEKVIEGVKQKKGLDALVISLDGIPDIDAEPETYQEHYSIFKDMAVYVSENYTSNTTRTFIGKGSESGVVLMTLFMEKPEIALFDNFIVTDPSPKYADAIINLIQNGNFPKNKHQKKLHYSFSTSNDREKCIKLIRLIKESQYDWLQLESIEYSTSDYENTYPISYAAGIKYIFK